MVPVIGFCGKTVVVFGLGLSGMSACAALKAGGAVVLAGDDDAGQRILAAEKGFSIIDAGSIPWSDVAALILSPGISMKYPRPHWIVECARVAGVEIIGDTELFERERAARAANSRLIAVTGTNGKSTSVALIAHILRHAGLSVELGGNIGRPVLSLDDVSNEKVYIIEYSSYQLDLTPGIAPDIGLFLNLSTDHLCRYGSMEKYALSKQHLVNATADRGGLVVIGVDDAFCRSIADQVEVRHHHAKVIRVSVRDHLAQGLFIVDNFLCESADGIVHQLVDLQGADMLRGEGNLQNAASAFAICRVLGISSDVISDSFSGFPGLPHRMEYIGRLHRVLFVNDSKATNANASRCALLSFAPIYWIVGGQSKSGGISSLETLFPHIAHAFLIGESASEFASILQGKVSFTISGDLKTAVTDALFAAEASSAEAPVVLLSPACASFDQFSNFEVRGEAFRILVNDLIHGHN